MRTLFPPSDLRPRGLPVRIHNLPEPRWWFRANLIRNAGQKSVIAL